MPRYFPNIHFSDCWSSAGEISFYHIDGKCYWRRKPHIEFSGTPDQLRQLDLQRRAIAAWQSLDHDTQLTWNTFAETVPAHRPPFLKENHISGYNLFVSSYHGHAQLGNEHIPDPNGFPEFPAENIEFESARVEARTLILKMRLNVPERYCLLGKIFITTKDKGCKTSGLRTFIAIKDTFMVEDFRTAFNIPDASEYQVHLRYLFIDSISGYRCNYKSLSFPIKLP